MFKTKLTEEELIAEMHNEFDTAPDRLLQNALNIMNEAEGNKVSTESEILDKARRLYKQGFTNTELVAKMLEITERNKVQEEIIEKELDFAERIKYYSECYPKVKFLTTDELNRICKKYSLVYAPVKHYTKTVPTENLIEIEENTPTIFNGDKPKIIHHLHYKLKEYEHLDYLTNAEAKGRGWANPLLVESDYEKNFSAWDIARLIEERYGLADKFQIDESGCHVEVAKNDGLFIAAPKKHFNTDGLSFDGTHGFLSFKRKAIKTDPVVFKFVKDGVLVITKWGLVGEDPLLNS